MLTFSAQIKRFSNKGEKTGWTYVEIPDVISSTLKPGVKKAYRVSGFIDAYAFQQTGLIPMGGGQFILPLNGTIRKNIRKMIGEVITVKLEPDDRPLAPPPAFVECLSEEPEALAAFRKLLPSHQHYFSNWIASAKTEETKAKRIAHAINALYGGLQFGEMIRKIQKDRNDLLGGNL